MKEITKEEKEYIVSVRNVNGTYFLSPELEFVDGLCDRVLWSNYTYKEIEEIIKKDAEKWEYSYSIEEF